MRNLILSTIAGITTALAAAAAGALVTMSIMGMVDADHQGPINNTYPLVDVPPTEQVQPEPLDAERLSELMPPPAGETGQSADADEQGGIAYDETAQWCYPGQTNPDAALRHESWDCYPIEQEGRSATLPNPATLWCYESISRAGWDCYSVQQPYREVV